MDTPRLINPPKRIQRKRIKGWRMPEGTIYVGRPTRWGNRANWRDFVGPTFEIDEDGYLVPGHIDENEARDFALGSFIHGTLLYRPDNEYPSDDEIRRELGGRDLACWCRLDQRCHADVLLAIANGDHNAATRIALGMQQ